jgi:hypothetical protein
LQVARGRRRGEWRDRRWREVGDDRTRKMLIWGVWKCGRVAGNVRSAHGARDLYCVELGDVNWKSGEPERDPSPPQPGALLPLGSSPHVANSGGNKPANSAIGPTTRNPSSRALQPGCFLRVVFRTLPPYAVEAQGKRSRSFVYLVTIIKEHSQE